MDGPGTRAMVVLALLLLGLVVQSSSVGAVGDPTLDSLIVHNPVIGWAPLSADELQPLVSGEQRTLAALAGQSVAVAAQAQSHGRDTLLIVLAAFQSDLPGPDRQARAAVITACAGGTGNEPTGVHSLRSVPHAYEGDCPNPKTRRLTIILAWAKRNVMALFIAGGLAQQRIEGIVRRQFAAVPASGVPQTPNTPS